MKRLSTKISPTLIKNESDILKFIFPNWKSEKKERKNGFGVTK